MTDSQRLLADYVQTGSETAFRELIARYVDLVYSSALRLVNGDTHRAEDVAQTVFLDLTHTARTLPPEVMLGGWLHRHTCFVAAKTMRGERRRQIRERQAVEMNALQTTPEPDFKRIAPLLDDAINELGDADRTAILLRFFEQHDFRSVGQALGSNEDAARMRVNRALEKLQELLKRRGLTSSAGALSVVLSANAVQAAPVGLALTISTATALTGTTLATTATVTATKAIAMTAIQKTIVTTTIAVLAGVGIYEARQAAQQRQQVQLFQQQQASAAEQMEQFTQQQVALSNRLAVLSAENARLKNNTVELLRLRGLAARLRQQNEELVKAAPQKETVGARPYVSANEFANAGLGSPEAALKTLAWATRNKDKEAMTKLIDLKGVEQAFQQMLKAGVSRSELFGESSEFDESSELSPLNLNLNFDDQTGLMGYQIMTQAFTSSNDVTLTFALHFTDGSSESVNGVFHFVDDEWKFDIMSAAPDELPVTLTKTETDGAEAQEVVNFKKTLKPAFVPAQGGATNP